MRYLVTGGRGFIGSAIVASLLVDGEEVEIYDLKDGNDILDFKKLETAADSAHVIIHLAAVSSVPDMDRDEGAGYRTNVMGTYHVLEAAVRSRIATRVIVASSAAAKPPVDSLYGRSKADIEVMCRLFDESSSLNCIALRYHNVYGPGQTKGVVRHFLDHMNHALPLHLHGRGLQTRDFIHIDDVVYATKMYSRSDLAFAPVIDIGSGVGTSIRDLAELMLHISGKNLECINEPRHDSIPQSIADLDEARKHLISFPKVSLVHGLTRLIGA